MPSNIFQLRVVVYACKVVNTWKKTTVKVAQNSMLKVEACAEVEIRGRYCETCGPLKIIMKVNPLSHWMLTAWYGGTEQPWLMLYSVTGMLDIKGKVMLPRSRRTSPTDIRVSPRHVRRHVDLVSSSGIS